MPAIESFRDRIEAVRTARTAAHHAKQRHPATRPQTVPSNRFVSIFGAGRQMPAAIADDTGQGQLVEPDCAHAQQSSGGFPERAGPIAAPGWAVIVLTDAMRVFAHGSTRGSHALAARLDLPDCIDDGVERQHGGSMPGFVVLDRLQETHVLKASRGTIAIRL